MCHATLKVPNTHVCVTTARGLRQALLCATCAASHDSLCYDVSTLPRQAIQKIAALWMCTSPEVLLVFFSACPSFCILFAHVYLLEVVGEHHEAEPVSFHPVERLWSADQVTNLFLLSRMEKGKMGLLGENALCTNRPGRF